MAQEARNGPDPRLDSWKEIAAFFGRDERTVRRWEKESGLPVHRVPGGTKARVYAYRSELQQWLNTPQVVVGQTPLPELTADQPEEGQAQAGNAVNSDGKSRVFHSARTWAVALILCVLLVSALLAYRSDHRFAAYASGAHPSIPHRYKPTPRAEDFYLKGRYYWNKRTPDDLNRALDYFMQAVVQDPNYAEAYVGLADCYNLLREYSAMPSDQAYARGLAAAKRAVELDEESSEAHASLAFDSFFGFWDLTTGEGEFRRAIELDPNNATAHHWYANALVVLGRYREALSEIERAQALHPGSSSILADKAVIIGGLGRPDEGFRLLKQLEDQEPGLRSPHLYLIGIYFSNQDYPNFIRELREDARTSHNAWEVGIAGAAEKGLAAGGRDGMLNALLEKKKQLYAQHLISALDLAQTYAMAGDKRQALKYLNEAYTQRDGSLLFIRTFLEFRSLHDEPEYRELVARIPLPG